MENGAVNMTGPMDQAILCLGMLEFAKELVHRRVREPQQVVQVAHPPWPPKE